MKTQLLTLFSLLTIFANATSNTAFIKMMDVNKEWANNPDGVAILNNSHLVPLNTYTDQIAYHLELVVKTLRLRPTNHLNSAQIKNRLALLDVLSTYSKERVFPINDYLSFKNPVFIDKKNTHCAVGHLMLKSGYGDLANEIDNKQKFAYIHDIKVNGVSEWASKHGFTLKELAWIQPAYQVNVSSLPLENGLNGNVYTTAKDANNKLFAGGDFTKSGIGTTCNNIAEYVSGFAGWSWAPLGSGVNGPVKSLLIHNNKLYLGGKFTTAGGIAANNIAVFDLISRQWSALGTLNDDVNALVVYKNEVYAGGKFSALVSKWNGSQWIDVNNGFLYGQEVRTFEVFDGSLYIGGDFELATGAIRKNAAAYDGTNFQIVGMGTRTPVNDFAVFKNKLYAAGDWTNGGDTASLSVLADFDWKVVLGGESDGTNWWLFNGTIKSLLSAADHLYAAGDFYAGGLMYYGNNVAKMNFIDSTNTVNLITAVGTSDTTINNLFEWDGTIGIAGQFSRVGVAALNHIGLIDNEFLSINDTDPMDINVDVFPNPSNDFFNIKIEQSLLKKVGEIKIVNQLGQTVYSTKTIQELTTIHKDKIASNGVFYVTILNKDGLSLVAKKVVLL